MFGRLSCAVIGIILLLVVPFVSMAKDKNLYTNNHKGGESVLSESPTEIEDENLTFAGHWPFGSSYAVAVEEEYAYVGSGGGIYVLDISDPSSPTKVAEMTTPGWVRGLFVADSYLYVPIVRTRSAPCHEGCSGQPEEERE